MKPLTVPRRIAPGAREVELASAGMPDPFLLQGGAVEPMAAPGPHLPLGIRAEVPYESVTRALEPGARLLLYSDGLLEAQRRSGEPLGHDGLASLVGSTQVEAATPLDACWLDALLDEVQRVTGPELDDDWTAVAIEAKET